MVRAQICSHVRGHHSPKLSGILEVNIKYFNSIAMSNRNVHVYLCAYKYTHVRARGNIAPDQYTDKIRVFFIHT